MRHSELMPLSKSSSNGRERRGIGVLVGTGVSVGGTVGAGVSVGIGVSVGTGVLVKTGVLVGGTGELVGTGVWVGIETLVATAPGVMIAAFLVEFEQPPNDMSKTIEKIKSLINRCLDNIVTPFSLNSIGDLSHVKPESLKA